MCPLCLCGSFHSLALKECILEYILPTKSKRAKNFLPQTLSRRIARSCLLHECLLPLAFRS
ncbi:hypothetical protein B5D77_11650 [Microcystis sp. MC19]|nr:hypothetical protein B5D77_11650 [Microcystis sp. MC19]